MEDKVKEIIINALKDEGYAVDVDYDDAIIVDDYETNNGVSVKIETLT